MKTPTNQRQTTARRKIPPLVAIAIGLIVIAVAVWGGTTIFRTLAANHAEEVAGPLEDELIKTEAIKKCSSGDNGRGWDNNSPHFTSTFEVQMDKDGALSLMQGVATKTGYHLTHASPEDRGPLGAVADTYIDKWYFDNTSKQSPFRDLEAGPIELDFVVYGAGEKNDCTQKIIQPGHSTIGLGISLPPFRH